MGKQFSQAGNKSHVRLARWARRNSTLLSAVITLSIIVFGAYSLFTSSSSAQFSSPLGLPSLEKALSASTATCKFVPRAKLPDDYETWLLKLDPAPAPKFSLLSAWLKPEYPSGVSAPKEIPEMYKAAFSMDGQVAISEYYWNQAYLGNGKSLEQNLWTNEAIAAYQISTRTEAKYGRDGLNINIALERYNRMVKGQRAIVIGSEDPWVEAMLLNAGAGSITTVEFGEIKCEHPKITTILAGDFTRKFLNGEIARFDVAVSFSSLEHDGLGRYGDVLNPIGDFQSMAKALSYVKPGGFFFLGLPTGVTDRLLFNAHREYGPIRMPLMLAGWHLVDILKGDQTGNYLYALQNKNGCEL